MTRRASRYDNDPDVNTRPDTVPGPVRFAEESLTTLDAKVQRELAPYPSLQPVSDEQTVNYGMVRPFSDSPGHTPSNASAALRSGTQHTPSNASAALRSGTQHTPSNASAALRSGTQHSLASTVPPPSRTRVKLDSATNEDVARSREHRSSPRAEEHRSSPRAADHRASVPPTERRARSAASLPAPPLVPLESPRKGLRTFLLGAVTAVVAAAIGASLGNGSLQGAVTRLFGGGTEDAPVLASPPRMKPAPAPAKARATAAPGAEPVAPGEASGVPVLSFQELPPTKQEAEDAGDPKQAKQPPRKRGTAPRRQ